MHERGGRIMADKRRYYHDKEGANSTASDTSRHSAQRDDEPPNSRLFLLCGRNVTEEELRESFEQFGEIKELWIVKEKDSGQSRGNLHIFILHIGCIYIIMHLCIILGQVRHSKTFFVVVKNNHVVVVTHESMSMMMR